MCAWAPGGLWRSTAGLAEETTVRNGGQHLAHAAATIFHLLAVYLRDGSCPPALALPSAARLFPVACVLCPPRSVQTSTYRSFISRLVAPPVCAAHSTAASSVPFAFRAAAWDLGWPIARFPLGKVFCVCCTLFMVSSLASLCPLLCFAVSASARHHSGNPRPTCQLVCL